MSLISAKIELECGSSLKPKLKTFKILDKIIDVYNIDNGREFIAAVGVTKYLCEADDGEIKIVRPQAIKQFH